jgi:hypothetical protein
VIGTLAAQSGSFTTPQDMKLFSEARGWVAVTESRNGSVKEIDLQGLPRPRLAVTAIEGLIASSAQKVLSV